MIGRILIFDFVFVLLALIDVILYLATHIKARANMKVILKDVFLINDRIRVFRLQSWWRLMKRLFKLKLSYEWQVLLVLSSPFRFAFFFFNMKSEKCNSAVFAQVNLSLSLLTCAANKDYTVQTQKQVWWWSILQGWCLKPAWCVIAVGIPLN